MYLNYKQISIEIGEADGSFAASLTGEETQPPFARGAAVSVRFGNRSCRIGEYRTRRKNVAYGIDSVTGDLFCSDGHDGAPDLTLRFRIADNELTIGAMVRGILLIEGGLNWGLDPENATFAVRRQGEDAILRAACGPAAGADDDALFDRLTDRMLAFETTGQLTLDFDWERRGYRFRFVNGEDWGRELTLRIHRDYCRKTFNVPYAPIRKEHGFHTPPAGWMSWYALQFTTREEDVIANAGILKREFGAYSAQLCCWVDWEWLHSSFEDGETGVDSFSPRPAAYPRGLAPVAAELSRLGLIPALWAGPTNEWHPGRLYAEHPDWLLGEHKAWCGRYWIDLSNPDVIEKFIPAVFRQVLDWGFKIVKWDCLPMTLQAGDLFHDRFRRPELSPEAALRAAVEAGRKVLGPKVYMLSCSGETERDITFAMDLFDAARIGGDVFGWDHFISSALGRVYRFYCWHNVTLYADADNLVLREEFNTLAQARSRVSFYGLTGLPVTIGDDLTRLAPERRDLLKKILPTVNIHPRDLRRRRCGEAYSLVNLAVSRPFGSWQVAGLLNLTQEELRVTLDLKRDLGLRPGATYAVFDFWNRKFLGLFSGRVELTVGAFDTLVLRVTEAGNEKPELVYSSRHLTQGAVEFESLLWHPAELSLSGRSGRVPDESWELAFLLPPHLEVINDGKLEMRREESLLYLELRPDKDGRCDWKLSFKTVKDRKS